MPVTTLIATLAQQTAAEVFGALVNMAVEESRWGQELRAKLRKRLGRQPPEQLAFQLALERALAQLREEHPGWVQSLFDAHLLAGETAAGELVKCLGRRGEPDARVLADTWAKQIGTQRNDLREEAERVACAFLRLLGRELDAPDVRPALAPLRTSRDLATLMDQGQVLQALVEQALARLDEHTALLSTQIEILAAAGRQGLLRVERSVTVHGNLSQAIIITGDGNRIELRLFSDDLARLIHAAAAPGASQPLRKPYLQRLLEQEWSSVSMSLFAPQDPEFGKRVKLTAIYTPLPVDFQLSLEFDWRGRLVDWWTGKEQTSEREDMARMAAVALERGEALGKQRHWPEMGVDEAALRPLVEKAAETLWEQRGEDEKVITWRPDACHAALVQPHFVLVGDPGSGKSTFLRHLAQCWAGELLRSMDEPGTGRAAAGLENLPGWDAAYTPIYLELRRVVDGFPKLLENQQQAPELPGLAVFRAFLEEEFSQETREWLFDALRRGAAGILLDGLDEIALADDPRRRAQIQAFVGELRKEFPQARIIVTSRPYAYRQSEWRLESFGRATLAPLPRERQAQLAQRLFRQLEPRHAEEETEVFVRALDKIPDDLASNPLLLTLLTAIWKRRKPGETELPSARGELYRRGLTLLLEDWVRQKRRDFSIEKDLKLHAEDMRLVLQLVAAQAQETRKTEDEDAEITEGDFFTALRAIRRGDAADKLVDHLEGQAGVLQELAEKRPGAMLSPFTKRFRFLHQSFQEYLAACEYLYRNEQERPYQLLVPEHRRFPRGLKNQALTQPDLWNNVLRLAIDELIYQQRSDDAWELLSEVCLPYIEGDGAYPNAPQAALLALDIAEKEGFFEKYDRRRDRKLEGFYRDLQAAAAKALTDIDHFPSPEDRDMAGRLLGQGEFPGHDPRPGVGVKNGLPDFDWVFIPAGEFIYRKDERRHEDAFWITRHPVTYAQFETFVQAEDGWRNPAWWQGLSRDERKRGPGDQGFKYWNHPREGVSWYDAIAFSRWLTAKARENPRLLPPDLREKGGDFRITLPTEWQWERAARGTDGREYPWEDDYKEGYANVDETWGNQGPYYLQKTSAVGMYPQGASPDRVLDLSGNVWEWCLNEYDKPDRIQETGAATRVVRGGSWGSNFDDASARARRGYLFGPVDRYGFIGFRVVVVVSVPH